MTAIYLQDMAWISALGRGKAAREALFAREPNGVAPTDQYTPGRVLHLGRVAEALPALEEQPLIYRSRTNALLAALLPDLRAAIEAARERFGPQRIAVILGVSAAGLHEGTAAARLFREQGTWPAGYDYAQQEMGNASEFLARVLGVSGPAYSISTACSSGAKALAAGARLLKAGREGLPVGVNVCEKRDQHSGARQNQRSMIPRRPH